MSFSLVWDAVSRHFFSSASMSRAISKAEVQVEGWIKGELIWLLDQLKNTTAVKSWRCECPAGDGTRKRMDFKIDLADTSAIVEVKTAIGLQKGTRSNPTASFLPMFENWRAYQAPHRYLAVFAYPAASRSDWDDAVIELGKRVPSVSIEVASVDDSPLQELSIGWLQVNSPGSRTPATVSVIPATV